MKLWKRSTLFVVLFTLMLALFGTLSAQADGFYYRFAPPLPDVRCSLVESSNPAVLQTSGITVEWNLPEDASIDVYTTVNGVMNFAGNFPVASGTGSQLFAGLTDAESAFPIDVSLRYDTIVAGEVVYQSTISFSCPGAGAGTASITNGAVSGGRVPADPGWFGRG